MRNLKGISTWLLILAWDTIKVSFPFSKHTVKYNGTYGLDKAKRKNMQTLCIQKSIGHIVLLSEKCRL